MNHFSCFSGKGCAKHGDGKSQGLIDDFTRGTLRVEFPEINEFIIDDLGGRLNPVTVHISTSRAKL